MQIFDLLEFTDHRMISFLQRGRRKWFANSWATFSVLNCQRQCWYFRIEDRCPKLDPSTAEGAWVYVSFTFGLQRCHAMSPWIGNRWNATRSWNPSDVGGCRLMVKEHTGQSFVLQVHVLMHFMLQLCFHMSTCCHSTVLTGPDNWPFGGKDRNGHAGQPTDWSNGRC